MKKIISVLLAILTLFLLSTQAFAASVPSVSSSKYITCYTNNSTGSVTTYTTSSLSTKAGSITCATDECKIIAISGNAVKVRYPISGGTKDAWCSRSAFTSCDIANAQVESWNQTKKISAVYKRAASNSQWTSSCVDPGDVCYKLYTSGDYTQIIYPSGSTYKMGWVKTADIQKESAPPTNPGFNISASNPIKCYTKNFTGSVTTYTTSALTTTSGSITCSTDECQIIAISGTAAKVRYPVTGGTKDAWCAISNFTSGTISASNTEKATKNLTTYRRNSTANSYGAIGVNETYYVIYKCGDWKQVIYKLDGGGYKMGWINTNPVVSSTWQAPMNNWNCTWSTKTNFSWGGYTQNSSGRNYHLGVDVYGDNGTVYAAASGKVVASSTSNSGANGRYIVIEHTLNGKTVYSFYAHLSSLNVSTGSKVSKGVKIAVAGGSGNGSNSYYGTHLHFAVVDTLWTGGGYYGYSTSFSGNKTSYGGVTYYNPKYVVDNSSLPS